MKVWVLLTILYNGHLGWYPVPTLEFSTRELCEDAKASLQREIAGWDRGRFDAKCVEIKK